MNDIIYRLDALQLFEIAFDNNWTVSDTMDALENLPSAQQRWKPDEWCTDCKEYDHERNCCPRFNHVIRKTLEEQQERKTGKWIYNPKDALEMVFSLPKCSECGHESSDALNYCPNCGARMEG